MGAESYPIQNISVIVSGLRRSDRRRVGKNFVQTTPILLGEAVIRMKVGL